MSIRLILLLSIVAACASPVRDRNRTIAQLDAQHKPIELLYDWNRDGVLDRAALVNEDNDDYQEFAIWVSQEFGPPRKIVSNQSFIWAHSSPGNYLVLLPNGDIDIISDHTAVGASERINVWRLSQRERDRFTLINYRYEYVDHLVKHRKAVCDLDLLEGRGRLDGLPTSFTPMQVDVNQITINFQPRPCKFKFRTY